MLQNNLFDNVDISYKGQCLKHQRGNTEKLVQNELHNNSQYIIIYIMFFNLGTRVMAYFKLARAPTFEHEIKGTIRYSFQLVSWM